MRLVSHTNSASLGQHKADDDFELHPAYGDDFDVPMGDDNPFQCDEENALGGVHNNFNSLKATLSRNPFAERIREFYDPFSDKDEIMYPKFKK